MDLVEFRKGYEHKEVIEKPSLVSSKPLVSVCVQTYQHANFIEECLDGILMQKTDFVFEILLGEDASTDGTREICISYAERYPDKIRLFLHHRENNIAIGGSPTGRFIFMTNLLTARGEYIALCEGDDYWTDPYKLQKQVDFLENNPEYAITFHDTIVQDEKGLIIAKNRIKNLNTTRSQKELVCGAHLPTNTILFRNILEVPNAFYKVKNGDTLLIALMGHKGKGYQHFDIANSVYRVHSGGIWSGISKYDKFLNANNTFCKILEISDRIYHTPLYRKLRSINYNLLKEAPKTSSRLVHLKKLIYYSWMYSITKRSN